MNHDPHLLLKNKLKELNLDTETYLNEVKNLLLKKVTPVHQLMIISYFTYSLNLSNREDEENILLGNFVIKNLGNIPINNPFILLKMNHSSSFEFSGKVITQQSKKPHNTSGIWERVSPGEENSEDDYWLRPLDTLILNPKDTVIFPNFQIKWFGNEAYKFSIAGFTYADEMNEGSNALNHINLSMES